MSLWGWVSQGSKAVPGEAWWDEVELRVWLGQGWGQPHAWVQGVGATDCSLSPLGPAWTGKPKKHQPLCLSVHDQGQQALLIVPGLSLDS